MLPLWSGHKCINKTSLLAAREEHAQIKGSKHLMSFVSNGRGSYSYQIAIKMHGLGNHQIQSIIYICCLWL